MRWCLRLLHGTTPVSASSGPGGQVEGLSGGCSEPKSVAPAATPNVQRSPKRRSSETSHGLLREARLLRHARSRQLEMRRDVAVGESEAPVGRRVVSRAVAQARRTDGRREASGARVARPRESEHRGGDCEEREGRRGFQREGAAWEV